MAFDDEIKDRLEAQGVGTFGEDIFIGSKADLPNGDGPYLTLIETGGTSASRTQNNTATERPTMQLVARATDQAVARAMSKAAYDALGGANGLWNVDLGGVRYLSITSRQNPTDIGTDQENRAMLSFNIDAEKQPS